MRISKKFIEHIDRLSDSSLCDDLHNHSYVIYSNRRYVLDEKHSYAISNSVKHIKDADKSIFNVPLFMSDNGITYKHAIRCKIGYGNIYYDIGGTDVIVGSMTNLVFYYQSNINPSTTQYLNITNASNRMLGFEGNILVRDLCISCYSSGGLVDFDRPVILRDRSVSIASIGVPGNLNSYFIARLKIDSVITDPYFSAYVAPLSNGPTLSQVVLVLNFSIASY
ncbi:MAG: hypothetical protein QXD03_02335 [Candidatus Anstonellales archaeon]